MDKGIIGLLAKAAACATVAAVYAGATLFFRDSFYFRTTLSDLKVGGYTPEAAQYAVNHKGEQYELILYGKGADKQRLSGKGFKLSYSIKEDLKKLKEEQNAWAWPLALITGDELEVTEEVTFDEALLEEAISKLSYFKEEKVIEPVDAEIVYNGVEYEIEPEVWGNKLNEEAVKETIISALKESKRVISLEESDCYEVPELTQDSKELIAARDLMNEYIQTSIVYTFGSKEEVVTPSIMSSWFEVDEAGDLVIDETKIRSYLSELDSKYSTLGKTRSFKASDGTMASVSGGDYGWQMSISGETEAIVKAIRNKESIHREPISTSTSQSYVEEDIGNSYVEINLTKQYLWFYKDGQLITQGSVVTGDQRRGYSTPQGTYKLTYKQRNATLNGPGYSTPVSFWMPFNGGIGIHDAVWRSSFGGNIYVANGSHGCVNVPYNMAQAIFNHIDESMPIICYY